MNDDEYKALRWLLGSGLETKLETETVRLAGGGRMLAHIGQRGDREALLRILHGDGPINPDVRAALACALEDVGASEMRLRLVLTRRAGRGRPSGGAQLAVEQFERDAMAKKMEAAGSKRYVAAEEAGKETRKSRATMYAAKRAMRPARTIDGN